MADETTADSPVAAPKLHVGIVGAGASGLRCADVLLAHGCRVTILEARDRIGGRICQSEDLGYTVDIGPNWIHTWDSAEVHPIFNLAQQTGTPLHTWNTKQLLYDPSGERVPDALTDRLSTLLWEIIEEAFGYSAAAAAAAAGDGAASAIPAGASLYDFVRRRAAEALPDERERELLVRMSEMWGAYVGEPVWRQSLRFAWMEECCGGEEMFVESDYSAILQRIAGPALRGATIHLGTLVTGIATGGDAPRPSPPSIHHPRRQDRRHSVTVTTSASATYTFDELVVSCPLGWLKRHHASVFSPALPPRLSAAIANIGLSVLEKVFITFPSAFWLPREDAAPPDDPGGEQSDVFPSYTNWLSPTYAPTTNPARWPQEIWNLASFRPPNRHPTLLFYTYGDSARHIVSLLTPPSSSSSSSPSPSPADPASAAHARILAFFRPYFSRLPGYSATDPACAPSRVLATAWQADELAGNASYCNFPVGIEAADEDVRSLRAGCGEGRALWFCGEHAAPFEECGTVAGAYLSGEGVAGRVLAVNGLKG